MSLTRTFINVAEGWLNYMMFLVSRQGLSPEMEKLGEERMKHCIKCPHLRVDKEFGGIPSQGKCLKCSCWFPIFVYAPKKSCPVGEWPASDTVKEVRPDRMGVSDGK